MKAGGPAFPTGLGCMDGGMTLRDWFAGQVLAGSTTGRFDFLTDINIACQYAEEAYRLADAMLAQREEREEQ